MSSIIKPHAICVPFPFQSHIKAMLKLAQLLHHRGFHITFVNTDFNHHRLLKSLPPNSALHTSPDFQFKSIPDGIPDSETGHAIQGAHFLVDSIAKNFLAPFRNLVLKLNDSTTSTWATSENVDDANVNPPVSCIVSDGFMSAFTVTAAEELRVPIALFFTIAACSFMGAKQYPALVQKGFAPLKDESCLTNGFLDQVIDWIPGMEGIRLGDLPNMSQTTKHDSDVIFINFTNEAMERVDKASAVVVHTFDALETRVLNALTSILNPPVYTIGPLELLLNQLPKDPSKQPPMGSYSLWKEETECLEWLNSKPPNSVVYVNFGSVAVMTPQHFVEFGWGLANSKVPFFWVIRDDLVDGESTILPPEFVAETKERGLIAGWCPQEEVLNHPSVGGFLTHSGWNSTLESLSAGVPMICWPQFADQQTNCYYTCNQWGIGIEMSNDVKRDEVENLVRELMEGEKGNKMKSKAMEWKKLVEDATGPYGSSSTNLDNLVNQVLLRKS